MDLLGVSDAEARQMAGRSAAVPGCGLCIAALLSVASLPGQQKLPEERLADLLKEVKEVKELKEVGREGKGMKRDEKLVFRAQEVKEEAVFPCSSPFSPPSEPFLEVYQPGMQLFKLLSGSGVVAIARAASTNRNQLSRTHGAQEAALQRSGQAAETRQPPEGLAASIFGPSES